MLKNTHKLLIVLNLLASVGAANVIITDPVHFDLDNGAWITLEPQTIDNISLYNSTGYPVSSVKFWINNTEIIFTAQANKTLLNISYLNDNFTWNGTGGYGFLNITAKMQNISTNYSLQINSTTVQNDTSSSQGWVIFTYPEANAHFYRILQTGIIIIIPPGVGGNKTIITFTDTSCLGIDAICSSEIRIIQNGIEVGKIKQQDSYIKIPAGGNISLYLKPSGIALLNNNEFMLEWLKKNWGMIFVGLLAIGLIISIIYIIKKRIS